MLNRDVSQPQRFVFQIHFQNSWPLNASPVVPSACPWTIEQLKVACGRRSGAKPRQEAGIAKYIRKVYSRRIVNLKMDNVAYDPQNVFARILRNEIPSERVYEDAENHLVYGSDAAAEGHVLVIPREPAETLLELSVAGAEACIRTTQLLASAVKRAFEGPASWSCR